MVDTEPPDNGQYTDLDGDGSCSVSAYSSQPQYSLDSFSSRPSSAFQMYIYNIFRNGGCSDWQNSIITAKNRCSTGQFLPGNEIQNLCCRACPANTYQSSTSHKETRCNDQPFCGSDEFMSEDTKNGKRTCSRCPAGTVQRATSHRETQCVDTTSTTTTTTTTTTSTTSTTTVACGKGEFSEQQGTRLEVSGACSGQSGANGAYAYQGLTLDGKAYYKNSAGFYLFYDQDCDGSGGDWGAPRWFLDGSQPSTTASVNLDGGEGQCNMNGFIDTTSNTIPYGDNVWTMWCDGSWTNVAMTIAAAAQGTFFNVCSPCPAGFYQSQAVHSMTSCESHATKCGYFEFILEPASSTQNIVCKTSEKCADSEYESARPVAGQTERNCTAISECSPTQYVRFEASAYKDRVCRECDGSYTARAAGCTTTSSSTTQTTQTSITQTSTTETASTSVTRTSTTGTTTTTMCTNPETGVGPSCQYNNADTCSSVGVAQYDGTCRCTNPTVDVGRSCQYNSADTCSDAGIAQEDGSCVCNDPEVGVGQSCQFSNNKTCSSVGVAQPDGSCVCSGPGTKKTPTKNQALIGTSFFDSTWPYEVPPLDANNNTVDGWVSTPGAAGVEVSKWKVAELKAELKERGLAVDGKKVELVQRLTEDNCVKEAIQIVVIDPDDDEISLQYPDVYSYNMYQVFRDATERGEFLDQNVALEALKEECRYMYRGDPQVGVGPFCQFNNAKTCNSFGIAQKNTAVLQCKIMSHMHIDILSIFILKNII